MNDERDIACKKRVPSPGSAAIVGISRPNDTIVIGIPVVDVLLYDLSIC